MLIYNSLSESKKSSKFVKECISVFKDLEIKNKSISILVGKKVAKIACFSSMLLEFKEIKKTIYNKDDGSNIAYVEILAFDKCIIINIIESTDDRIGYIEYVYMLNIISLFKKSSISIANLIIVVDKIIQDEEEITNINNVIKEIYNFVKIDLPVYFIFNVLGSIEYFNDILKIMPNKRLYEIIGVINIDFFARTVSISSFEQQIKQIGFNLTAIAHEYMNESKTTGIQHYKIISCFDEIKNYLYNSVFYATEIINSNLYSNKIALRHIIVVGEAYYYGINKTVFLSNFFYKILNSERNGIYISTKDNKINKSSLIETIIAIISIVAISYITICSIFYTQNTRNYETCFSNIVETSSYINDTNLSQILNMLNKINIIQYGRYKTNIYYLIEDIIASKNDKSIGINISIIDRVYNKVYVYMKNYIHDCFTMIGKSSQEEMQANIARYNEKINTLITMHNNICNKGKTINNLIRIINYINPSLQIKSHSEDMDLEISGWKEISLVDLEVSKFTSNIIGSYISKAKTDNPLIKIDLMNTYIKNLIFGSNVYESISEIINIFDNCKIIDIIEKCQLHNLYNIVNTFYEINYISEDEKDSYILLVEDIKNSYIQLLNSISNPITGNLVSGSEYSDSLINLYKVCKSIYDSDLYKSLSIYKFNNSKINLTIDRGTIIKNPSGLISIVDQYKLFSEFKNDVIGNLAKQVICNIYNEVSSYFITDNLMIVNSRNNEGFLKIVANSVEANKSCFEKIVAIVGDSNSYAINEFAINLASKYIQQIEEYILSLNLYNENNEIISYSKYYIQSVYLLLDKNELSDEINRKNIILSEKVLNLKQVINMCKEILEKSPISLEIRDSLQFVISTINDIEKYNKNNPGTSMQTLSKFIVNNIENKSAIHRPNIKIIERKDYASMCYEKLVTKMNENINHYNYNEIINLLQILQKSIVSIKCFPIVNNNNTISVAEINNIKNSLTEILDLLKVIKTNNSSGFKSNFIKT